MRRSAAALLLAAAAWSALPAAPVAADPAGPTDYRTEVVSVVPAAPGVHIRTIGGDAFVSITADPGTTVEVIGYRGEPYLRYLPGGIVEENANSPTTYLNIDRYAAVEVPPTASAVAEPDWRVVAEDGSYAWHDHRAHWMNTARPPGRAPGDVILEGVIPLRVSGIEVDVGVRSLWVAAPSILPVLAGMMAGLALVAAAALRKVRPVALAAMLAAVSAAAAGVGLTAYLSVPPETGPSWALWAPPAASAVAAGAAAAGRWFRPLATWSGTLSVIAALELVVWGFLRREWMWSAIVPTEVPWLDRAVTGAVLVAGIGLLMLVGRALAAGGTTGARSA